jgi:hypothetical protein
MSKKFPGFGLGNPHRVRPKTEISRPENHVLKNSMSRFWWTPPPVQANSRWPKTDTVKNAMFSVFKWVISGGLQNRYSLALFVTTDRHNLIYFRTGSDWKNLSSTAQFLSRQTDITFAFILVGARGRRPLWSPPWCDLGDSWEGRVSGRVAGGGAVSAFCLARRLSEVCYTKWSAVWNKEGMQWECGWEDWKREREGNWAIGERGMEPKPK